MLGLDKYVNYIELDGEYWVKLSAESNSIRFTARFEGYICAYVVGDFNSWEKSEEFKLTWKMDYNDGILKLTKDITFENGLKAGLYKYTYVLVDDDGNEVLLYYRNEDEKPVFNWVGLKNELEIKASEDSVILGVDVELVAIRNSIYGKKEIADVIWEIEPKIKGVSILDGVVNIDKTLTSLDKVEVTCYEKKSGLSASRTFKVINKERKGTLIHFIRTDEKYLGEGYSWDLWTYSGDRESQAIQLNNTCDFGKFAVVENENVIARRKAWGFGWRNDWSEQTCCFKIPKEKSNCYIIYGETELFTNLKDVISKTIPRVECAIMDESNKITAYLSHEPLIGTEFDIYVNGNKQLNINTIIKDRKKEVIFTNLPTDILANDLVEVRATNMFLPCKALMRNVLDNLYYEGDDMGITFNNQNISLRLWAPTASKVELLIYDTWDVLEEKPNEIYQLKEDYQSGTFYISINREKNENKYYLYRLHFKEIDREGNVFNNITYAVDPYAVGVGVNGDKGVLLDINSKEAKPKAWGEISKPELINREDAIIYEMHIRDFTINEKSGVEKELRGKYLGVVQEGTSYTDIEKDITVSTGIDHLVEFGITHVHILPFFDFSSVDERYSNDEGNRNWGYDPKNYNVPEGSYSTDPFNPFSRIKELRGMINGLHKNGIRVVMDMVYNHMGDTSNLDKIVPGYYFRSNNLGRFTNGSGCGNELATERPMVSKFIVDSIIHWTTDYQIDGLRFDLMELMDFDTMKKIIKETKKLNPSMLIYGEPWKGGDSPLTNGTYRGRQKNEEFSIFNDMFRDVIRGNNEPANGFVNGDQHNAFIGWNILDGLKGSINGLTSKPVESINYVDAHDNYTLWDQIEKSQNFYICKGEYRNNIYENPFCSTLVKQNILAISILLTAEGVPFIQGGTEFLRTKNGDHNSYKSNDKINALHWEDKAIFKEVFDYYKGLVKLRKAHPAFKMKSREEVLEKLKINFINNDERAGVIISHFSNNANGDEWKDIVVIYNGTSIDDYNVNQALPNIGDGTWKVVVNNEKAGTEVIAEAEVGRVPALKAHSIMVIYN